MRGLFFKIFIIFWIAESLIFVISTALILRRHFEGPEVFFDMLNSTFVNYGSRAAVAYETGGCPALRSFGVQIGQQVVLTDSAGQDLCNPAAPPLPALLNRSVLPVSGMQVGQHYLWRVSVTSASGKKYDLILSRKHLPRQPSLLHDLARFSFPQLPVAIVVGGLTTFFLVVLLTRPIARLREAARQLATGNLQTRVEWPTIHSRSSSGDEISALMLDFNHMAERLESLMSAQKLLLRDVSHELRSPLSRLSVALELAREDASPAMSAHLDRIEREADRLNVLIGQLLTLSSMEAQEKLQHFDTFSLNRLVHQLLPDAEFEAQSRPCSIVFNAAGEYSVCGNPQLLQRAIENIVRNAIRHTAAGSEIEISLYASEDGHAEIEICDRGPGFPDDQLRDIFRPFYRVDSARSPETGGFGVGLAIADRAVRLHKGEICALNRSGGGGIVRITLPLVNLPPALRSEAQASEPNRT